MDLLNFQAVIKSAASSLPGRGFQAVIKLAASAASPIEKKEKLFWGAFYIGIPLCPKAVIKSAASAASPREAALAANLITTVCFPIFGL